MLMLLREDKLRLMGGKYEDRDMEADDPDDVLNDEYWKNNYVENEEEEYSPFDFS
jgi:hypothetical protein